MNFGFVIDNRKCIGCHACTVACKAEHQVPIGVNRTWVKYIEKGVFPDTTRHFSVMRCNHCSDAPCVEICPVSALTTRSDGIVDFDNRRCIGCKACMQACPYDALYLDPESHTAAKCNYCAHRVDIGLEPACVNVCPEHAIVSGDLDDPQSEIAGLLAKEQVSVRKEEKGTEPKLFYIDGDQASLRPHLTEPSGQYMWSSQASGVGHFARYAESRASDSDPREMAERLAGSPESADWIGSGTDSVLVPAGVEGSASKARDVAQENARRVFDAPSKGAVWGWEVAAYIWTKAIASGVFLVGFLASLISSGNTLVPEEILRGLCLIFLALTGLLLIKDLDKPGRFLYVLLRPQWRSWLVRGAYIISIFGFLLTLRLFSDFLGIGRFDQAVDWLTGAFAALTALYTAFLFSQAKGRDFWQSPLLAVHMLTHAIMAGAAVLILTAFLMDQNSPPPFTLRAFLAGAIIIHLVTLLFEFMTPHPTRDGRQTADLITRSHYGREFWIGAVLLGNIGPLAVLLVSGDAPMLLAASALVLIGIYVVEHIWVRAPQMIALS